MNGGWGRVCAKEGRQTGGGALGVGQPAVVVRRARYTRPFLPPVNRIGAKYLLRPWGFSIRS